MTKETTAEQLAEIAHKARPNVLYRAASNGASVAAWVDGRWVPVAGRLITGEWAELRYELLVDGKPAFDAALYGAAPEGAAR